MEAATLVLDCERDQCQTYFGTERFKSTREASGVFSAPAPYYFKFSSKASTVQGVTGDPWYYFIGTCKKSTSAENSFAQLRTKSESPNKRLEFTEFGPEPAIQQEMSLQCRWMKSVTLTAQGGTSPSGNVGDESGAPINLLVLGGKLSIVTEGGNERLHLLGHNISNGAMFFAENTPSGNSVLWSFYTVGKEARLFFKQNNYMAGAPRNRVTAWNHLGECRASGGNGRAVTK